MSEYTVVASRGAAAVVRVRGRYEDGVAPRLAADYDLAISTDEPDGRLARFHEFLRRRESMKLLGAAATPLTGCLRRRPS